jgi:hypothetical protein
MDKAYIFKIPVSLKKFDEMILIISRKIIK